MKQAKHANRDQANDLIADRARGADASMTAYAHPSSAARQRAVDSMIADSPRMNRLAAERHIIRNTSRQAQGGAVMTNATPPPNRTGIPDGLKAGIEGLSGISMDHVRVHYNSSQPAQFMAHAFAQGGQIHLAPGQEHHLPHEAWHVVQQAQGRVRATRQAKGGIGINDDPELESEADVMGARALQLHSAGLAGKLAARAAGHAPDGVAQLAMKLKIGISGNTAPLPITWQQLPPNTYVWILTNRKVEADALDARGVQSGKDKATVQDIIDVNTDSVNTPILRSVQHSKGMEIGGLYQSGIFEVPRRDSGTGNDYSLLRYAAFENYRRWSRINRSKAWPDMDAGGVIVETIDSDVSGITQDSGGAPKENNGDGWLAQAGVYKWNLDAVKADQRVVNAFDGQVPGALARQVEQFGKVYTQAEIDKRSTAASASILSIYFPEPATRLSSYALTLLGSAGFGGMKITRGDQLGFGRESIGMIAELLHLDRKSGRDYATSKLSFDASYIIETDLGIRKDAYVSLFLNWEQRVREGANATSVDVVGTLPGLEGFDQSYLKPGLPEQIQKWHYKALENMSKPKANVAGEFFHP